MHDLSQMVRLFYDKLNRSAAKNTSFQCLMNLFELNLSSSIITSMVTRLGSWFLPRIFKLSTGWTIQLFFDSVQRPATHPVLAKFEKAVIIPRERFSSALVTVPFLVVGTKWNISANDTFRNGEPKTYCISSP